MHGDNLLPGIRIVWECQAPTESCCSAPNRWCNQLDPAVNRAPFTHWEDAVIICAWQVRPRTLQLFCGFTDAVCRPAHASSNTAVRSRVATRFAHAHVQLCTDAAGQRLCYHAAIYVSLFQSIQSPLTTYRLIACRSIPTAGRASPSCCRRAPTTA